MDKPNDLHDHYNEMLDILTHENAPKTVNEGAFYKYYAMKEAHEFILLYTLANSAKDLLSHKNTTSISFEINKYFDSEDLFISLDAYIHWNLDESNNTNDRSGSIYCCHGNIYVEDDIPEELDEDVNPDFYEELEKFASCMELFTSDILYNNKHVFDGKFNYDHTMSFLRKKYDMFFTLLEKNDLSKEINNQDKPKPKRVKIL